MELEQKVELAIKRIEYILNNESNRIAGVYSDEEGSIILVLENGMNFRLTSGEMEYRADEQIENEIVCMDRDDVINEIADNYIETVRSDISEGDTSFLNDIIVGNGMKTLNDLTNEHLVVEYKELFNKDIIIND